MDEKRNLIALLAQWLAAGKLDSRVVLPAIQKLAGGGAAPKSLLAVLETLEEETDPVLTSLAAHLRESLRQEALRFYGNKKQGLKISGQDEAVLSGLSLEVAGEWRFAEQPIPTAETALERARELGFLAASQEKAPHFFSEVKSQTSKALDLAHSELAVQMGRVSWAMLKQIEGAWASELPGREPVLSELRARMMECWRSLFERASEVVSALSDQARGMDDGQLLEDLRARFAGAESSEEKARILDLLCAWPTPAVCAALEEVVEPWAQDRTLLNLTVRFGRADLQNWEAWRQWLASQYRVWQAEQESFLCLIQNQAQGALLILYSKLRDPDPAVLDALVRIVYESGAPLELRSVIRSWAKWVPIDEQRVLLGLPAPMPPPIPPIISEMPKVESVGAPAFPPPLPKPGELAGSETGAPRGPSFWEKHLQPLFVENWYIVAGIAMVILGSSLLAYYTWDKHWLVRYTIMPALLGLFTWSLAGVGGWIEKKGAEFKSTAAILRGAAIGLLPINFMAMAVLSADEKVPQKAPALVVMGLIYLSVFGWSLRNWCGAVEPALRNRLAAALLLLNLLVAVGPLARTMGHLEGRPLLLILGAGFYLGFLLAVWTIVWFTHRVLTREMAEEKRVPWFAGASLAVTFLQVFVWVHGFMRHLPRAHTYALLVILIGWLILFSERRALELRLSPQLHGGESFLGFAFILLGLLMGFTEPTIRIFSFWAAGAIWMYQAFSRRHALHYWIALTLLGLGGAAIGLLPHYPGVWLPLLGVALAVGYGLGSFFSQSREPELAKACRGLQVVALVLTTIVAPLTQWHYRSEPLATAGWLLLVAALFAWRALKERQIHWLHATTLVLALVLPYAGFVDMANRTPHHNTMVFGLAILSYIWLVATWLSQRSFARRTQASPSPQSGRGGGEEDVGAAMLFLQARSTVLWFYGILAVAAMLLRVALGDTRPVGQWYHDTMDYLGPILMTIALVPATYYSRSLAPAGMPIVIMVILFPELKAQLQRTFAWITWGTGLASAISALGLTWLCFFLRRWPFLKNLPEGDRFMGRDLFPLRRHDYTLFTWPMLTAALLLIIKVDTWNLSMNLAGWSVQLKTAAALVLTGVTWTFLAIYHREHRASVTGVHLGWLCALAGVNFGYWGQASEPNWTWPFLVMGLVLQLLYWLYRFGLESRYAWVKGLLTEPTRMVLLAGSAALALVCCVCLLNGAELERLRWLYWFLIAQLVWHSLGTRNRLFGTILFFQIWIGLLALTAPGPSPLWERFSVEQSLDPTLWLVIAVQLVLIVLEISPESLHSSLVTRHSSLHHFLAPLVSPGFVVASLLAILLGLGGIVDGVHEFTSSRAQQILLLAALLLTARAHVSGFSLLVGFALSYVMVHREMLVSAARLEDAIRLLVTPWRLAVFGLAMVLLTQAGRWVHQRRKYLLAGPFAQTFFTAPSCGWLFVPAGIICSLAAIYHTSDFELREDAVQLWAPYLGAMTFALVAFFWQKNVFFAGAGLLLLLGNIHLVRVWAGVLLREHGLSELHLICLGIGLTLLQVSVLRRAVRAAQAFPALNLASLGLAFSVLALLSINYFIEPDLAGITPTRFIVSGTLAWLAGWYFRRAARHPAPGETAHVDICEGLYHFGVVLAIWCAALLLPWFRQPFITLIALGLPVGYFYVRAELGMRAGLAAARRYRNSAAVLGFVILALYVFKGIFHMVLLPGTPITTQYYHYNSPLIILLAVVLLRLHGLGGTAWLAFYGGVALMTGSYFLLTALPGFSPFDYPMPSAWCALGLAHFWILVSYSRSPVRTVLQRLAKLDDPAWHGLRRSWGYCLLAASQGAAVWGICDYSSDTYMVAPLLATAATIFIHQGIIRLREPGSAAPAVSGSPPPFATREDRIGFVYLIIAAIELTMALHMDFLIPSYLPKADVIWALLVIWVGMLAIYQIFAKSIPPERIGSVALCLASLVFAHVLYHHPWSQAGLWAIVIAGTLAAWNPQRTRQAANAMEQFCGGLLLLVPVWLVYFSQAPIEARGIDAALEAWPILATAASLFLLGLFARLFPLRLAGGYDKWPRSGFRLFDLSLAWLKSDSVGEIIHRIGLCLTLVIVCTLQVAHYQNAFAPRELVLLVGLEAALTVAWYCQGRDNQSTTAYYLMQLSAAACYASMRRHFMLTTAGWNYEYDVWASLVFSFLLAGAKQILDLQPRNLRRSLLTSLFALPVMALIWVLVRGLGVNMALLVVGLHSVMFAYLGKDNRESPYNIVALGGFVAFILVTFYTKLHLRAVHAYIIPTGLGVLVLQELFRDRIKPDARNWIRLVTLMAMLGSSAYYALADSRHAISFNLTMIALCLLSMALGSLFRIRLYLAMGFAGLMVDLISILYKVLVHMERSARMTVIGTLVLIIGALLVFGAIYYKTNKAALDAWINQWRGKLVQWE